MGRFYETTFFNKDPVLIGWQLLASPAVINNTPIDYKQIIADISDSQTIPKDNESKIYAALAIIGDPIGYWSQDGVTSLSLSNIAPEVSPGYLDSILKAPYFAVETSPVHTRTILELLGLAESTHLVIINNHPALVLLGDGIGLIVIRTLTAVGGAMWKGASRSLEELGEDIATTQLDIIRDHLGIKRRKRPRSKK